jgi:hypothetical protein
VLSWEGGHVACMRPSNSARVTKVYRKVKYSNSTLQVASKYDLPGTSLARGIRGAATHEAGRGTAQEAAQLVAYNAHCGRGQGTREWTRERPQVVVVVQLAEVVTWHADGASRPGNQACEQ